MLDRKLDLICAPTPIHPLSRISKLLGADIWIKRDDLTGFAGGGNKGRKLEYLMADAIEAGADTIVTHAGWQSNFIRQAAAACRVCGLDFHAVAMEWPYPDEDRKPRPPGWPAQTSAQGNQILDAWLDAKVDKLADDTYDVLEAQTTALAEKLRVEGRKVYEIPGGGSSGIGALGYVRAAEELLAVGERFNQVIVACGSGATQTGLAYGFMRAGARTQVIGICTDKEPELVEVLAQISAELDDLLLTRLRLAPKDFDLRLDYCGAGYQAPTPESREAISLLAKTEGIFLDPVYTSKAFAAVIDLAGRSDLPGKTLFWHTGGFPGLFVDGYGANS